VKELLKFTTHLASDDVLHLLQHNTFPSAGDFHTLPFGPHYFSGVVSSNHIRIRNALRFGRGSGISPILKIAVQPKPMADQTEIVLYDDTEEEIQTNHMIVLTISLCISVTILLVGTIGSFASPAEFSLPWVLFVSLLVASPSLFFKAMTRIALKTNADTDMAYLVNLLKR
jgi:hypothetical protein